MADNTMFVPVHKKNTDSPQVRDDEKELVDSILQDTEDLGHRLLSMSQYLWISHARISLYTTDELVTTTSRLKKISKDFYKATEEAAEEKRKEDKERDRMRNKDAERDQMMLTHEFLRLSSSVLARPNLYKNELAMMFTVEDEEEYERVEHAADEQETKSQTDQLKEWMDDELECFAGHRSTWERSSGSKSGRCGGFEDKTTLSPMQFTHCIPGIIPPRAAVTGSTLQIYSFKIVELSDDLKWPLRVYGVVAARDTVDRNRNLLFARSRIRCQVLTQDDSYLRLTGPSRAILAVDYVDFEVELKVHDGDDELKDTQLMCAVNRYDGKRYDEADDNGEHRPLPFDSPFCRAELRFERLLTTVQATILSIRFIGEEFPFKFGGQVACVIDGTREKVVLFHSIEEREVDLDGYVPLSRNVVSVDIRGGLDVVVEAYGRSGSTSGHFYFPSKYCNTSQGRFSVCGSEVEITVAWSRLVGDKMAMLIEGYTTQVLSAIRGQGGC
ncbi:uncharacterized protein [Triticum aestivum]|uniref:uncharacterized protein n=1 Tax=Triticum aestivum TaxID=4565 RepID=UPI001D00B0B4|nr:uncharacterized protein LOC123056017 [Triticum aestivum]